MYRLLLLLLAVAPVHAGVVVFENVNVVTMENEDISSDRDVFVEDAVISDIVEHGAREIPANAKRVQGKGGYLVPGLAEMHSHLVRPGGNLAAETVLDLYVANGVTFIRGMSGHASHLELGRRAEDGDIAGPRMLLGSPPLSGEDTRPEDVQREIRNAANAGFEIIKVHEGLSPEAFRAALAESRAAGLRAGGHVPDRVGARAAVRQGLGSIEHMDNFFEEGVADTSRDSADFLGNKVVAEFEREQFVEFADEIAARGNWIVPTLTLFEHMLDPELSPDKLGARTEMQYVPAAMVSDWQQRKRALLQGEDYDSERAGKSLEERRWMLRTLHERGANIMLGADSPQLFNVPGFATHRELAAYINAGLTPYQALYTATAAVGEYLGDERHGVLRRGAHADLLLVDDNPLEDIATLESPRVVMVRGRLHDRRELDRMLAQAKGNQ